VTLPCCVVLWTDGLYVVTLAYCVVLWTDGLYVVTLAYSANSRQSFDSVLVDHLIFFLSSLVTLRTPDLPLGNSAFFPNRKFVCFVWFLTD